MNNEDILKQEIQGVIKDIKELYEASGKKATGRFAEGLSYESFPNSIILKGYTYTEGSPKGTFVPFSELYKWAEAKGLAQQWGISTSTIAEIVQRKILREGTNSDNARDFYSEVLTAERIQKIIDKVSSFNLSLFTNQMNVELKILERNVDNIT